MSRHTVLALVFASALGLSAGCIENMDDLKVALGAVDPAPAAEVFLPPLAKAEAITTAPLASAPVELSAEGSKDPQGMALAFAWDFGDGTLGDGVRSMHTFAPGDHLVRLTVTNTAGLADIDTLALHVAALDRAPSVGIRAPMVGIMGEPLVFEALASDPEGRALSFSWDFGDGSSSSDARASHAYAAPGLYDVRIIATDAAGNTARDAVRLAIGGAWHAEGTFAPLADSPSKVALPIVAGAKSVTIDLTFDGSLPINDLEIAILDATGSEIAHSDGGIGSAPERHLSLEAAKLVPGAWSVLVQKGSGVSVAWTLDISEHVS